MPVSTNNPCGGSCAGSPVQIFQVDLTGMYLDVDNGYDGFSLDNTRTTLSDQPGHDRQETLGASARIDLAGPTRLSLSKRWSATSDADLEYGYDEGLEFRRIVARFFEVPGIGLLLIRSVPSHQSQHHPGCARAVAFPAVTSSVG